MLPAVLCLSIASSHAEHFSLQRFGRAEGLDNLLVRGVTQDTKGHLWLATPNGAFRFDGHHFRAYGRREGLPSADITTWLTLAGICRLGKRRLGLSGCSVRCLVSTPMGVLASKTTVPVRQA